MRPFRPPLREGSEDPWLCDTRFPWLCPFWVTKEHTRPGRSNRRVAIRWKAPATPCTSYKAGPLSKLPPLFPVYYCMADYWERLIEELVLELLEDLLERPQVWEAEAWLAGVSVEELLAEEIRRG